MNPPRERHTQALASASDLGAPLEEARALEGLGQSHLQDASPGQAAVHLRQALAIYQRIGAPAARRVQQTLENYQLASTIPEHQPAVPQTAKAISPHMPAKPHEANKQAAAWRHSPSGERDQNA